MISVQNISKDYGSFRALHNLSFDVTAGEVLGLLGPNGAGKTTILRILTGFFPPTEGRVSLNGVLMADDPVAVKRRIGYLPEQVSLYPDLRVEELLRFVAEIKGVARRQIKDEIENKMSLTGVLGVRRRLVGELSKGFRQRLGLAQALVGDPDVLILDEPTNGLDPHQIIEIRGLIRELGRERTLILSTHILPEASLLCGRVLILNQGRIAAEGRPSDLERGLGERQEILLRVGERVSRQEGEADTGSSRRTLEEILGALPGVEWVEKTGEENRTAHYTLQTTPFEDLRAEISRRVVEAGFPLLELSTKRLSLEDIFLRLVTTEKEAASS